MTGAVLAAVVLISHGAGMVRARDPASVLPDQPRRAELQTPKQFFGFEIGSRHLRHDQVLSYLTYLADASGRVTLIPYGRTHGKRPLLVAAITSAENSQRLGALRKRRRRLTSGGVDVRLDEELLVMYMGYSVHGDESSAVNAAPLVAYHLASSEEKDVQSWLSESVFLLDPALNPDGVDRFANWANENRGKFPSPSSLDREHNQPWPGGRTNYYWFDLNRDWLPGVHPESQGRLRLFHQWKPKVVLDFHEMSGNSSYFFQPGIPARNNPLSPAKNLDLTRRFAAEHAASLDAAGELFLTEERFDDFYVGKGSTYPDLHGAVGILFEQGSTRGLQLKNARTDRHFADTVANQIRTSLSSLKAAHELRVELLQFQTSFYAESLKSAAQDGTRAYVLTGTASRIAAAARLLDAHAIEVYQPPADIRFDGIRHNHREVLVVPRVQAETTFVQSLMEPVQSFRENIFYDVSTWHLPSALDLQMQRLQNDIPETWLAERWKPRANAAAEEWIGDAAVGYAFAPTELAAPRLVSALQAVGTNLRVTTETVVSDGGPDAARWPLGTFLVLKQPNAERWPRVVETLRRVSVLNHLTVEKMDSSMTPVGPDLGSDTMLHIPKCNPLLVVGSGTRAYSAGALWHHLDVRMRQRATLVDTHRLASADLRDFSCVILPEGSYSAWSSNEVEQLKTYVRGGGTVIAIASAIRWLDQKGLIQLGDPPAAEKAGDARSADARPPAPRFGDARRSRALESIAGAFLMTELDPTHPLGYGFPHPRVPVFRDHTYRFARPKNPYQTAAHYDGVIAGYVSERNRQRLDQTAAAWIETAGRGRFILLADNPVFRGYVRSSERFFTNALLLGPAIQIPSMPASGEQAADGHGH